MTLDSVFFAVFSDDKCDEGRPPPYDSGLAKMGDWRFIGQNYPLKRQLKGERRTDARHSTVTDLARLRGWSTSVPFSTAT